MRWPLVAIAVSFVALFATVGTAWLLCVSEAAVVGPPPPPSQLDFQRRIVPFPDTLSAEEVIELVKPLKSLGVACGDTGSGEECWRDIYVDVTIPWQDEPAAVVTGFTRRGLMSFQVNNICYKCEPGEKILKRRTN